ncbi:DUF411 domain-containing protein [Pseudoalteromonas rubra]|uniref:DUF411 domain-containing protein n=1 Tax=Pseudoalteromonas rubra TaxID=43658 RepID=A0A5S3V5U6_9GAMM|nr:DUF411 domain-containing protein [Pseudoalteromonas rubra]QPB82065.1 DUF411 domain-containing protein [Pseudoalteromonas rubra]
MSFTTNKYFLFLSACLFWLLSLSSYAQSSPKQALTVYKTPTCGCCKKWLSHLLEQGVNAQGQELASLSAIKSRYGIAARYRSCHTAVSHDGWVFEGHVPARFIQQFLANPQKDAIGLAVPAMPLGSPGMEVGGRFMPYQVLLLMKDGSHQIYAQVNTYKEQF